jgi:hypothetical protein
MSATFNDATGQSWSVAITVSDVKRVKRLLDVNLYGLLDDKFDGFTSLIEDPVALVDVVYVLCQPQADTIGLSDEQFGERFHGDTIESAALAFMEAFRDFCPSPRQRAAIAKLIETWHKVGQRMGDLVTSRLAEMDIDAELDRYLSESSGTSGDSPGSPGSTPAP